MSSETEYLPGTSRRANDQVRAYEASDGAKQGDMRGVPVIILTTRGRKSGALRKAPLMRVTDGERYAVIASLGGAPEHPVWYLNLLADPEVTLQDKDVRRRYRARTTSGAERRGMVGPGGRGLAGLQRLPDQDGSGDPGRPARAGFRRLSPPSSAR